MDVVTDRAEVLDMFSWVEGGGENVGVPGNIGGTKTQLIYHQLINRIQEQINMSTGA